MDDKALHIGHSYLNKKHGTTYVVTGFARHSETLECLVLYERKSRIKTAWARPLNLFYEKFTNLDGSEIEKPYYPVDEVI